MLDRWGEDVTATLDALSARLTTDVLRRLDAAAATRITRRGRPRVAPRGGLGMSTGERTTEAADRPEPPAPPAPAVPTTARRSGRHRRPSGAAPPLPRSLGSTGKGLLVVLAALLIWVIVAAASPAARRATDRLDALFLRLIAHLRTPWLTTVFRGIDRIGIGWLVTVASLLLIVALIVLRRWRHLFTFLGSVLILELVGVALIDGFKRPRPYDVTILDRWKGFSMPSRAGGRRDHRPRRGRLHPGRGRRAPRGGPRSCSSCWWPCTRFARLYLAVDHPFDVLVAIALAAAIPVNAFRFFTPNEVFPVSYRQGQDGPPRRHRRAGRGHPSRPSATSSA